MMKSARSPISLLLMKMIRGCLIYGWTCFRAFTNHIVHSRGCLFNFFSRYSLFSVSRRKMGQFCFQNHECSINEVIYMLPQLHSTSQYVLMLQMLEMFRQNPQFYSSGNTSSEILWKIYLYIHISRQNIFTILCGRAVK